MSRIQAQVVQLEIKVYAIGKKALDSNVELTAQQAQHIALASQSKINQASFKCQTPDGTVFECQPEIKVDPTNVEPCSVESLNVATACAMLNEIAESLIYVSTKLFPKIKDLSTTPDMGEYVKAVGCLGHINQLAGFIKFNKWRGGFWEK